MVIDDTAWNQFNVGKMIASTDKPSAPNAHGVFYGCCPRARNRLAVVFLDDLPEEAVPVVKDWFGAGHVVL